MVKLSLERKTQTMAKTNTRKKTNTTYNNISEGGVYYSTDKNRYIARFTADGKRITVGSFMTERKAKIALKEARASYPNW
jgi:heat shock protein HslJ